MRFLRLVPGNARQTQQSTLIGALIGAVLAGALIIAVAGPVAAAVPGEPETGVPLAATSAQPAAGTTAAATPAATPVTLTPGLSGFDNIGADTSAQLRCLSDSGYSFDVIDALGTGWDSE